MATKERRGKRRRDAAERMQQRAFAARLLGPLLLGVEVLVLPAAASPFRVPKMALAVAGLALLAGLAASPALWRRGSWRLPGGRLAGIFLALPLLQALSALWADHPRRALAAAATTAAWTAGLLLLAALGREARLRAASWAGAGAVLSGTVMLLQAAGAPILQSARGGRFALAGLAGNPADLAMATIMLAPLLLGPLADRQGGRLRTAAGLFLVGTGLATRTLTGLGSVGAMAVGWLLLTRSRRLWSLAAGVAAVGLAAALLGGVGTRVAELAGQARAGNWYGVLSARADGWSAAAEMIRTRPVLGVGAGNYGATFFPSRLAWLERRDEHGARGEQATHFSRAHCDPLQLVAELGIPGLAWLAALLWLVLHRLRRDPAILPAALAALPFLLLHYPAHVAVGLVPLVLVGAALLDAGGPVLDPPLPSSHVLRRATAVVLLGAALATAAWQVREVRFSLWLGSLQRVLRHSDRLPPGRRERALRLAAATVERRMEEHPGEVSRLLPELGRALLAAGDAAGAEEAFRLTLRYAPRAEAALGLGLALARQGRTTEALVWLERAGRVNPALLELVPDRRLREQVRTLVTGTR